MAGNVTANTTPLFLLFLSKRTTLKQTQGIMKSKLLMIVSILLGLMMLNAGLNKFFNYMPVPEMPAEAVALMTAFMVSGYLFSFIALTEIIGGILLFLNKTRALGAIVLLPITVNILLFHLVLTPGDAIVSIIIFFINVWIIYENREKYLPMIC